MVDEVAYGFALAVRAFTMVCFEGIEYGARSGVDISRIASNGFLMKKEITKGAGGSGSVAIAVIWDSLLLSLLLALIEICSIRSRT